MTSEREGVRGLVDYDAGLLNDFGGGDVNWWQDYLRAEIERANEFWREQTEQALAAEGVQAGEVEQRARELLEVLQAARNASAVLSHIYNTTPLGDLETDAFDAFQRLDTAMSAMRYEWFNVKNDCWTPIDRLPHEWERELGIQWRLAETGGNTNAQ